MQRKQRTSNRRKKELKKLGIRQDQGHGMGDNGLPLCRIATWNSKLPSRNSKSVRRRSRNDLAKTLRKACCD
jgi:hypothetical protein